VDQTSNSTLATVPLSGGSASLTVSSLSPGSHTIAAVYSGDGNYITSAVTLAENVDYGFSGFLPPLSNNLSIGLGRSVPIKFQLTDANGYVSDLSAIVSLQVLNGGENVLALRVIVWVTFSTWAACR
jgi:hypothetical protein